MSRQLVLGLFILAVVSVFDVRPAFAHGGQDWIYPGVRCQLRGDALRQGQTANLGVSQFGYISNVCDAGNCPTLPIVCPIDRGSISTDTGIDVVVKFATRFMSADITREFNCTLHNVSSGAFSATQTVSSTLADIADATPGVVVQRKFASMLAGHLTRCCRCKLPSSQHRCFKMPTWRRSEHNESNRCRQVPPMPNVAEMLSLRGASQINNRQVLATLMVAHIKTNVSATVTGAGGDAHGALRGQLARGS